MVIGTKISVRLEVLTAVMRTNVMGATNFATDG